MESPYRIKPGMPPSQRMDGRESAFSRMRFWMRFHLSSDLGKEKLIADTSSPDQLSKLARNDDTMVLLAVAQNPHTPTAALSSLSRASLSLAMKVAENPNAPAELVAKVIASYPIKKEKPGHHENRTYTKGSGFYGDEWEYSDSVWVEDPGEPRYPSDKLDALVKVLRAFDPQKRDAVLDGLRALDADLHEALTPLVR